MNDVVPIDQFPDFIPTGGGPSYAGRGVLGGPIIYASGDPGSHPGGGCDQGGCENCGEPSGGEE